MPLQVIEYYKANALMRENALKVYFEAFHSLVDSQDILRDCFESMAQYRRGQISDPDDILSEFYAGREHFIVYLDGFHHGMNSVIGFFTLIAKKEKAMGDYVLLADVAIEKKLRAVGYGHELLKLAHQQASIFAQREQVPPRLQLETELPSVNGFYKKAGCTFIGTEDKPERAHFEMPEIFAEPRRRARFL